MKLIRPNQVSGMNIHYKFYSLEYFLEPRCGPGFKTILNYGLVLLIFS